MENFGGRRRYGGGGRRFGGDFSSQDKPVKEGETYDVEIIEVGSRGDGIAKIQNFVIFVPGTNKGDKVKVRITKVRSSSAVGEVVSGEGEPERIVVQEPTETSEESEEEESEETVKEEPTEEPKDEPEETGEEEPSE
jgi:predicted RNA-binding protein with TRAM domain